MGTHTAYSVHELSDYLRIFFDGIDDPTGCKYTPARLGSAIDMTYQVPARCTIEEFVTELTACLEELAEDARDLIPLPVAPLQYERAWEENEFFIRLYSEEYLPEEPTLNEKARAVDKFILDAVEYRAALALESIEDLHALLIPLASVA